MLILSVVKARRAEVGLGGGVDSAADFSRPIFDTGVVVCMFEQKFYYFTFCELFRCGQFWRWIWRGELAWLGRYLRVE